MCARASSGRAYLTGFHQFVLEQDDPLPAGFRIGPQASRRAGADGVRSLHDRRKPPLRSASWFGRMDNAGFEHRTHLKARGAAPEMFDGRPVIGIANSASDLVPCNAHLTALAEWVSRGVLENGGYPLVFPTMSIGNSIMRPSGMLFRNLMSMELEALLRANPLDGVVLLTGCDNTAPAYMMGAASVDLPTIVVHGGAMISGYVGQRTVGSGHRHLQALRRFSRRQDERIRLPRFRSEHVPQRWPLQHHGHGGHDGVLGGSAGIESAGLGRHSRGGC